MQLYIILFFVIPPLAAISCIIGLIGVQKMKKNLVLLSWILSVITCIVGILWAYTIHNGTGVKAYSILGILFVIVICITIKYFPQTRTPSS